MKIKEILLFLQKKLNHFLFQRFYENLYGFSLNGMGYGYGGGMETNGELKLMNYLKKNLCKKEGVIFDVGANIGEYSFFLTKNFKNSKIYSFEPSKKTFQFLLKNTKNFSLIEPVNIGFGNKKEIKILYSNKKDSAISTLHNRKIGLKERENVNIEKLDNFCKNRNIEKIDFLKIDVEGNELNILEGAKEMLNNKKISFIQFEFGIRDVDSKVFFRDFWDLLHDKYNFYRIFNKGIYPINEYKEKLEIFTGMNYFCELKKS
jgi:FkbM family methyltransferase